MNIKRTLIVLGVFAITAGCSSLLAPRPDHSRFFILTPVSDANAPTATSLSGAASRMTIGVGPINFPDYLRRAQVVTRSAPNQIELSEERRWGEPLDVNFARVLSENLAQLLNTPRIEKYPWPRKTEVDYQVTIDVQRFEMNADGQAQLQARWAVKDGRTGKDLFASQTATSSPSAGGEAEASAALSRDLSVLSREIASSIDEIGRKRAGTTAQTRQRQAGG